MAPDRSLRWMPAAIGLTVLAATAPLALSRDFGVFVATTFVYVPALLVAGIGLLVWGFAERHPRRKISIFLAVAAIAITAPTVYIVGSKFRDRIVFAFWSQTHVALISRYATRDGIIAPWDSWGFAGLENDSYLVADHGSALFSSHEATKWARRRGGKCDVVDVQLMRRGLYILTTYECPLQ
jgi:hypothetical protein